MSGPMKINSASDLALAGIRKGMSDMRRSAAGIASADTANADRNPTQELANMKQSARQVEAASRVIKSEDEMVGTLLDVKV